MCGINIIISKQGIQKDRYIRLMNNKTYERGPDQCVSVQHIINEYEINLGCNRLQVIDNDAKSQIPMYSYDNRYVLAFNGFISNFKELRNKYQDKHAFQTQSDTEVLLYHLIHTGKTGIENLNGMFAFFFLDLFTGEYILARDRHGIKPLFYYKDQDQWIISSTIEAILENPIPKNINKKSVYDFLIYRSPQGTNTMFEQIYEVQAGEVVTGKIGNTISQKQEKFTKQVVKRQDDILESEILSHVEHLLIRSIERNNLAVQSPVLCLSGGVDSTLLLFMNARLDNTIPCYTVYAGNKKYTDEYYAQIATKQLGYEHHLIDVSENIQELFNNSINTYRPVADPSSSLTFALSQEIKKRSNVMISGAGADEWFAGYNRHKAYLFYLNSFQTLTPILNNPIAYEIIKRLPISASNKRMWEKYTTSLHLNKSKTWYHFIALDILKQNDFPSEKINTFEDALQHDRKNYLPKDVLSITDTFGMKNQVEGRLPYLDNELTNFIKSLPVKLLIDGGSKWIIKKLLQKHGAVLHSNQPKRGFGINLDDYYRSSEGKQIMQSLLQQKDNLIYEYVAKNSIENIFTKHIQQKRNFSHEIWSIIYLNNWLKFIQQ